MDSTMISDKEYKRVDKALRDGYYSPEDIADYTKLPQSTVIEILKNFEEWELVNSDFDPEYHNIHNENYYNKE